MCYATYNAHSRLDEESPSSSHESIIKAVYWIIDTQPYKHTHGRHICGARPRGRSYIELTRQYLLAAVDDVSHVTPLRQSRAPVTSVTTTSSNRIT